MIRGKRLRVSHVIGWVVLGLALIATFFPFYWMVKSALTPASAMITEAGRVFPTNPTMINFARVMGLLSPEAVRAAGGSGATVNYALYLWNSVMYSGLIAGFQTLFCAMGGYAFARLRFWGRNGLFYLLIAALMVPGIFTLLPNFVLIRDAGLFGTIWGMVAPSMLMTPFALFFMRQFFLPLPRDVEEAAMIDGAGKLRIFWRVALPMAQGPLVTIGLITFVNAWKDYMWPLLVARDNPTVAVALGVYRQQSPNTQPDWTGLMAASAISIIPVIILLAFFGRRIVASISFTGIK